MNERQQVFGYCYDDERASSFFNASRPLIRDKRFQRFVARPYAEPYEPVHKKTAGMTNRGGSISTALQRKPVRTCVAAMIRR